jgi:hypothetical protein
LTLTLQRVAFELERLRDNEAHERKILTLRLENMLLRAEHILLPTKQIAATGNDELSLDIERLKQENEEFRRRLSQLEKS